MLITILRVSLKGWRIKSENKRCTMTGGRKGCFWKDRIRKCISPKAEGRFSYHVPQKKGNLRREKRIGKQEVKIRERDTKGSLTAKIKTTE